MTNAKLAELMGTITATENGAIVEEAFQIAFGRAPKEAGKAYWVGRLEDGLDVDLLLFALLQGAKAYTVVGDPIYDNANLLDLKVVDYKIEVANAYEAAGEVVSAAVLATVTDVATREAAIDALSGGTGGTTPTPVDGNTFIMTDGRDVITGTDGDDTIYGDVGQNQNGALANGFSTGDVIDGGAGRDTLITTVMPDVYTENGGALPITARTVNLEVAKFQALNMTPGTAAGVATTGTVTIDAGRMDSVEEFWSVNSSAHLIIQDVRLGSKLGITKQLTFGLESVDYGTEFTARLDSQSFQNSGQTLSNSEVSIRIADVSTETPDTPLANVSVTIGFSLNGTAYVLEDVQSTDGTYAGLRQAIDTALSAKGLSSLNVTFGESYTQVTVAGNTVTLPFTAQQTLITDPSGGEFSDIDFTYNAIAPVAGGFLVAGNAEAVDPVASSTLIETNLILDDAGRGSTAGAVWIGGMSNSNKGIEKFNVMVDRDSKIASLGTSSNRLQEVEITSLDAKGDLAINALDAGIRLIDASQFQGSNLSLGATTAVNNLTTLSANIAGNVTFNGSTTEGDGISSNTAYSYTTGSGNDRITFNLDGDSVDALGESFTLNTGAGNDTVTITMGAGVSQLTMVELQNLSINLGAGNDTLNLNAYGNFYIDAGTGNDFVRINSVDANGDASTGAWTFGDTTGPQTFGERVLYEAKLTLSFAGFEKTVNVTTTSANNFKATQVDINKAIMNAIDSDATLSKLLTYSLSTGNQQLEVESTVGGDNTLAVAIYQPQLVATAATAGQVDLSSTDLASIRKGLIDTTTGDSDTFDTVANIVTWTGTAGNNWYGSVSNTGAADAIVYAYIENDIILDRGDTGASGQDILDSAVLYENYNNGGSSDATVGVNLSKVNPGAGDDIVVFHSNAANSNVLELTGAFGSVKVVNFHNVSTDLVDDAAAGAAQMGMHALDFTSILNNLDDASTNLTSNTDSATSIATTLNVVNGAESLANTSAVAGNTNLADANGVNTIRFDSTANVNHTFDKLNASTLVAALNDANGTGTTDYANLTGALLTPSIHGVTLVGNVQKHIIMVENDLNQGEYKVFSLTSTLNAAKTATSTQATGGGDLFDTTATLLGTLDFGASINFQLVGNGVYESYTNAMIDALDKGNALFTYDSNGDGTADATAATPAEVVGLQTLTVAGYTALVNAGHTGFEYNLVDTAPNLAAAGATALNGAGNITATSAATVAQAVVIEGASNSGDTVYNLSDTAANLAGTTAAVRNNAEDITVTDAATVAQAATIVAATNSGDTTISEIEDTAANIAAAIIGGADFSDVDTITHTATQVAGATGTDTVEDIFVFASGNTISIANFEDGTDIIDVSAFIGATAVFEAFTDGSGAGPVQILVADGGTNTTIAFDTNDNGSANFTITLTGVTGATIDANDFVFGA